MSPIKSLFFLTAILLTGGCASFRVETNLLPESDAALQSPAGRFYVAGLEYVDSSEVMPVTDAEYEKRLLQLVRKESLVRYPQLFAADSADAVPLWVEVVDSNLTKDKTLHWMLGTLLIAPMILPMPLQMDREIGVTVGSWNGQNGIAGEVIRQSFRRQEYAWTSLTPVALIPIPGKSNLPKKSEAINAFNPNPSFHNRVGYDDLPQVAQQVATAIAKMVAEKDAVFWAAAPRWSRSSSFPSSYPSTAPAALPLPGETVAPF